MNVDDLVRRLDSLGERLPATDEDRGMQLVRIRRRRHHARRISVTFAVIGAVVVPTVVFGLAVGDNSSDEHLVTATLPETTTATTTAPSSTATPPDTTEQTGEEADPITGSPVRLTPVDITLGPPVVLERVDVESVDISSSIESLGADDAQFEWLVEWKDGFLLALGDPSGGYAMHFSTDGDRWERLDVALPEGAVFVSETAVSTGSRFAIVGFDNSRNDSSTSRVLFTTTDMVTWDRTQIRLTDPAAGFPSQYVQGHSSVGDLAINETGWGLTVANDVSIETFGLVEDRYDGEPESVSSLIDGLQLTLEVSGTTGDETITIDLTELGFTPDQIEVLNGFGRSEMWTGTWDSPTAQLVEQPTTGGYGFVTSYDNGIVTRTPFDLVVVSDGKADIFRVPDERYSISGVVSLGPQLLVLTNDPFSNAQPYVVDPASRTWSPTELPGLASTIEPGAGQANGAQVMRPRYLPPPRATEATFEQGDYRYTRIFDSPTSSYEVERISTSEVVVAESRDVRQQTGLSGLGFDYLDGGPYRTTIIDPATGDVIIDMDIDDLNEMNAAQTATDGSTLPAFSPEDFDPFDLWLIVHDTSTSIGILDLPEPPPDAPGRDFQLFARNGNQLLANTATGWFRYTLSE